MPMDNTRLSTLIEERKQELFDLLSAMIRIDSQNFRSHGNEEALAHQLETWCQELGMETCVYSPLELEGFADHPDYMPGRGLENRPNMTARLKGASGRDELMLMGHLDTVEIGDLANWQFDPLSGEQKDGKIWGRGACDDKYALATILFILRLIKEQKIELKGNLLFSAYCDEEHGGSHGALAACLKYPVSRIVNMDCKGFDIWHCASGGGEVTFRYHTKDPVDSARTTALALPTVIHVLDGFAEKRRAELAANPYYAGTIIPDTSLRYMDIKAGSPTSLGSGALCFTFYTDRTKEEILKELDAVEKEIAAALLPLNMVSDGYAFRTRFFHYAYSEPDCEAITDMCQAAQEVSGRTLSVCGSCLSDLSVILKYGSSSAFGFGIGRDFAAPGGAHQPNEFIECADLVEYAKIIADYVLRSLT